MKKKLTVLILLILVSVFLISALNYKNIHARYLFIQLELNKDNMEKAKPYMSKLSNSVQGINICLKDISICYSKTSNLSSWVIRNAVNKEYSTAKLRELTNNQNATQDQLIEANLLLWDIAKDTDSLGHIFKILSKESQRSTDVDKNILLVFSRGALLGKVKEDRLETFLSKYNDGSLWEANIEDFMAYFE